MISGLSAGKSLLKNGDHTGASDKFLRILREDKTCHEAMFLLGCIYLQETPIEATKYFARSATLSPDNEAYLFFSELAQKKSLPSTSARASWTEENMLQIADNYSLSALPMDIMCSEAIDCGYSIAVQKYYQYALLSRGREREAHLAEKLALKNWQWFIVKSELKTAISGGRFDDHDLKVWLYLLQDCSSERSIALAKFLATHFLGCKRSEREFQNVNNAKVQTRGSHLHRRNVIVFSTSNKGARILTYGR